MPLNIDQINEQLNAANPGKIAVVKSLNDTDKTSFLTSMEDFNPAVETLLDSSGHCTINTESQRRLAEIEIKYLLDAREDDEATYDEVIITLQRAIIQYLEEQLDYYKDSPYAEVSD